MLYASTRNALTKTLGSNHFADTLFATSKADITPEAYAAHKASAAAPQPLSRAEREMAEIREAERQASGGGANSYQGMRARKAHVGPVGYSWAADAEEAVRALGGGEDSRLVVLVRVSWSDCVRGFCVAEHYRAVESGSVVGDVDIDVKHACECRSTRRIVTDDRTLYVNFLPASYMHAEPCPFKAYAFYAWAHTHANSPRRDVGMYACTHHNIPQVNQLIPF
jgi:twinfilin-like protein